MGDEMRGPRFTIGNLQLTVALVAISLAVFLAGSFMGLLASFLSGSRRSSLDWDRADLSGPALLARSRWDIVAPIPRRHLD